MRPGFSFAGVTPRDRRGATRGVGVKSDSPLLVMRPGFSFAGVTPRDGRGATRGVGEGNWGSLLLREVSEGPQAL